MSIKNISLLLVVISAGLAVWCITSIVAGYNVVLNIALLGLNIWNMWMNAKNYKSASGNDY